MRDERVHVDVAAQVELDQLGHLVASLDAAERGPAHPPPGDEQSGDDVERLALARHAGHRAHAPSHAGGFDRLSHHGDQAGGLERVIGSEASRRLQDPLDGVFIRRPAIGRPVSAGELQSCL